MGVDERQNYILKGVQRIVRHAFFHNEFYGGVYREHGFAPDQLVTFDDICRIPVVTKALLKSVSIDRRSSRQFGRILVNTGGTSGEPLHFYLDRGAIAREWGHMHRIWSEVGYRPTDLKLTFRGKNLGGVPIRYNALSNEYLVSAYCDLDMIAKAVSDRAQHSVIRFIHGYPSLIYEFAVHCSECAPHVVERLRSTLRGIMLGSEYPAPVYRESIEAIFQVPTISWYGHSEAAVLAFEANAKYCYEPMMTYGYAETVQDNDGLHHLVATSYYNTASPFIRYDTGDIISPQYDNGLLSSFRISEGRFGEFILDKQGRRISLTALVFGRHHDIFERARFVQLTQACAGEAVILVTLPQPDYADEASLRRQFDLSGADIDFRFSVLSTPYITPSGKVPLLVNISDWENDRNAYRQGWQHSSPSP
jgi:phenylacetate-CoA ligase